ncbi:GH1 family beta-glucosidase [Streptomyces leeuwenhoekii]|uniref:Beta-glucosidase n=1 Tax=Streptomyces leeuwenhoekii TaxID=1437453 RepID=A0A0F7VM41_STRLW|nr:GH1 family beta-glucosidase [Streptomyces leeuwenhoekii]KMS78987.1 beta-glucosidase [Streptomyces leeuwenhoekii]CQR60859.1 Beta-glucosidase A [Streptomyces leeuwenhoekii]
MSDFPTFPPDFVFGAATAAFQIEGAAREDGRGPSIWDTFARRPGAVAGGDTGDVACDHYHRYREDIALLRELGVRSYRFSVSWPRVQPTGSGPANAAGLDFYRRLVDGLLEAGIEPAVTLYHWDLPQALEDRGGWRDRDTAHRFADYARLVAGALADRVPRWITLNEPWCSAFLGHANGHHAPGSREGTPALAAAHHLLVGHGLSVPVLREAGAREVGITLNLDHVTPATGAPQDAAAALRAETQRNLMWTEPLLKARYADGEDDTWEDLIRHQSFRRSGDLDIVAAPLDFLGINYYTPSVVRAAPYRDADPLTRTADDNRFEGVGVPEARHTAMGWPVVPHTLRDLLVGLRERYGDALPPVHITENGCAEDDVPTPGGAVHDTARVTYLDGHLRAVADAIADGVDVRGYYVWSLLDNFEWAYGYSKRFGLVYVDYATQRRIPKDSYHWYRDLITEQRGRRAAGTCGTAR